jgi:hypothetical protein
MVALSISSEKVALIDDVLTATFVAEVAGVVDDTVGGVRSGVLVTVIVSVPEFLPKSVAPTRMTLVPTMSGTCALQS